MTFLSLKKKKKNSLVPKFEQIFVKRKQYNKILGELSYLTLPEC